MRRRLLGAPTLLALALAGNVAPAVVPRPPPTAVALPPSAWGFLSDGGVGPIDGTVDYSEANVRVVGGYASTTPEMFRGIYEFDLSDHNLPAVSASLSLQVYDSRSGFGPAEAIPFRLYGYIENGQVTAMDYSAGALLSTFTISSLGTFDVDVSSFVSSALFNGNQFVGFNLRPNGNPNVNHTAYYFGTPAQGPISSTLAISPIPEPRSYNLILPGAIFLRLLRYNTRSSGGACWQNL